MQTEQQSLRAAAGQRFWQIDALRGQIGRAHV